MRFIDIAVVLALVAAVFAAPVPEAEVEG